MDDLWLSEANARAIVAQAENGVPNEICGLLAGHGNKVLHVIQVENAAEEPEHHFRIDQRALNTHLPQVRDLKASLLGFYHSHPRGEPIPSPEDIRHAVAYDGIVHVIVGLTRTGPKLAAWYIKGERLTPVTLRIEHIDDRPAEPEHDRALSRAQRYAIILSALVALVILVIVAITLLPPAPDLSSP